MAAEKRKEMNCFASRKAEKDIITKAADIEGETVSVYMRTIVLRDAMRAIRKAEKDNK